MGPLHIEIGFTSAIREWLRGSGWVDIFKRSKINAVGRIESFLSGTNLKRSRYAHQVSLASLVYPIFQGSKPNLIVIIFCEIKERKDLPKLDMG